MKFTELLEVYLEAKKQYEYSLDNREYQNMSKVSFDNSKANLELARIELNNHVDGV